MMKAVVSVQKSSSTTTRSHSCWHVCDQLQCSL